jgi:hypothetical protein
MSLCKIYQKSWINLCFYLSLVDRSMKELQDAPAIDWLAVSSDPNAFALNQYHTHADVREFWMSDLNFWMNFWMK